jgi:CMD domain protein
MNDPDTIDLLAGLAPGSPLSAIRDRKPVTRQNAEASYRALFEPVDQGDVTSHERCALAMFVAGLHAHNEIAAFYAAGLAHTEPTGGLTAAIEAEISCGRTNGPYGAYPPGPLSVDDVPGPVYQVAASSRAALGARMSAALAHVHLLVFHPRDANPTALQALLDAGWSTTDIVTLSQLVAFLAFQIRIVVGLRILSATPA